MKHEEITAWALEELTPEARAHLEEQLAHNPEIRQKARETKQFCDLLVQELRAASEPEGAQTRPNRHQTHFDRQTAALGLCSAVDASHRRRRVHRARWLLDVSAASAEETGHRG
jgi:hypothetical protein